MNTHCPLCNCNNAQAEPHSSLKSAQRFSCPRCERFVLTGQLLCEIEKKLRNDTKKRALISHAVARMQKKNPTPTLDIKLFEQVLNTSLPSLEQQIDNLILFLGEFTGTPGKTALFKTLRVSAIIGSEVESATAFVVAHVCKEALLEVEWPPNFTIDSFKASLTFMGWKYYSNLLRGKTKSKNAFMAMPFGDPGLDEIVEKTFKPAVKATGFTLIRADDVPKAGLIDDHIRVMIRTSRFVLADLSHDNSGAYWEAGYAEGLGKPVIYTCEKSKFESQQTHFDTNHHLTVE